MKRNNYSSALSIEERSAARILVVESDVECRRKLVDDLRNLRYQSVSEAASHIAAIDKFEGRRFTHMIFSARRENYPVREWLSRILEVAPNLVAICMSDEPSIDDVFSLLMQGGRGFLVKPFTQETLDYAITLATKSDPLSDKVRRAGDPNQAILAMVMTSLDNLAVVRRHARKFDTARRELAQAEESLRRTAELVRLLTKSDQADMLVALEHFFVQKSAGPASPLGRLRKRLNNGRSYVVSG